MFFLGHPFVLRDKQSVNDIALMHAVGATGKNRTASLSESQMRAGKNSLCTA
jgi:hypothetical protein